MKIVSIGGGPSGLMLAIATKQRMPDAEIHVHERNQLGDTFGFGVVFSDETLSNIRAVDPVGFDEIESRFRYWSDLEVRVGGETHVSGGHGFAALARVELLNILSRRAGELGVELHYESEVSADQFVDADLIVGGDGVNSGTRNQYADSFQPTVTSGGARFFWSGTEAKFDRFTFLFEETEFGYVQAHCYPFDDSRSTFIVELSDENFAKTGMVPAEGLLPGESDPAALAFGESVFADALQGAPLLANNTKWLQFPRVRCEQWHHDNIVLVGDAVHTAHYSIGSGTKLALEDAIALSDAVVAEPDISAAIERYENERKPVAASLQRAAMVSEDWFQRVDHYADRPTKQFVLSCLTRSQRVTLGNLAERDADYAADVVADVRAREASPRLGANDRTEPFLWPFELAGLTLANRIVVAPMMQYSATDGLVDEWHLVHYGARAVGGAGLLVTETAFVSADARATPACAGIWTDEHATAWRQITDFTHQHSTAKIGIQIGHAGRRGATAIPSEGGGPLGDGGWPLLAPSAIPHRPEDVVPAEMTQTDMDSVCVDFAAAARRCVDAGFDLLEVHAGHGQLLSTFLSPHSNRRNDEYGGSLENRARFPVAVVAAVREEWPTDKPLAVRISATDWVPSGFDRDDAVGVSEMFKQVGVDAIDVSAGEIDSDEDPPFGRLYLTPLSDAVRHGADIPTIAVGNVTSIDDVNTVIVAGRADLCMIGRPHLIDPYWTLNARLDVDDVADEAWPRQYEFARAARRRDQTAARA